MSQQMTEGIASYESVNDSYLKRRRLRASAGAVLLWSLGVGPVIGGNFFGWNFGLAAGGFWGLFIATLLMAIMYICIVYSIAELSAALPHTGGFYSFTRNAFGPFLGFICGVSITIEYVIAAASNLVAIRDYLHPLIPAVPVFLLWLLAYAIFVSINIRSLELTLNVSLLLTLVAIMVLVIFYLSILVSGIFIPQLLFTVPADPGQSANWLPKGWNGVFAAIPSGIWFYLAIEQVPLAAEESRDVGRNMPKALIVGMFTLIALSLFTLVLNSGVGGGAAAIGESSVPLAAGLQAYFGKGATSTVVTAVALTCGVISSFHNVIYAYGRVLFSLSRAGYLPRWISVTGKTNTPYRALLLGAVVGLICAAIVDVSGNAAVSAMLLNMAVFGALISYILVMCSYIKLKIDRPDLPRPYSSPLGIWGAAIGACLAIFALFACFSVPAYRPGLWGTLAFLIVAIFYFSLHSKNQLVAQAPEEKVALIFNRQVQADA